MRAARAGSRRWCASPRTTSLLVYIQYELFDRLRLAERCTSTRPTLSPLAAGLAAGLLHDRTVCMRLGRFRRRRRPGFRPARRSARATHAACRSDLRDDFRRLRGRPIHRAEPAQRQRRGRRALRHRAAAAGRPRSRFPHGPHQRHAERRRRTSRLRGHGRERRGQHHGPRGHRSATDARDAGRADLPRNRRGLHRGRSHRPECARQQRRPDCHLHHCADPARRAVARRANRGCQRHTDRRDRTDFPYGHRHQRRGLDRRRIAHHGQGGAGRAGQSRLQRTQGAVCRNGSHRSQRRADDWRTGHHLHGGAGVAGGPEPQRADRRHHRHAGSAAVAGGLHRHCRQRCGLGAGAGADRHHRARQLGPRHHHRARQALFRADAPERRQGARHGRLHGGRRHQLGRTLRSGDGHLGSDRFDAGRAQWPHGHTAPGRQGAGGRRQRHGAQRRAADGNLRSCRQHLDGNGQHRGAARMAFRSAAAQRQGPDRGRPYFAAHAELLADRGTVRSRRRHLDDRGDAIDNPEASTRWNCCLAATPCW